jgi:hypothetical protein
MANKAGTNPSVTRLPSICMHMKTGAFQCYSQANLGAVLGKTTRQDRGLGTNLLAVRVPWVFVLPIDTRVQREGGALNGFLSETIFAHPRYKGSLFPYT